jgi:hypothetical protein
MKRMISQLVQQKFSQLNSDELIKYGKSYGFHLSKEQADQIVEYIHSHSLDPFNERDRLKLLKKIAKITDEKTAQKAHKLFKDMIKKFGVSDLF